MPGAREASSGLSPASVHPEANTTVTASITGMPAAYTTLPAWVNYTLTTTNFGGTINSTNTAVQLTVYDVVTQSNLVVVSQVIVSGQTTYSLELNSTSLNCGSDTTCTSTLVDNYELTLSGWVDGTASGGTNATFNTGVFDVVSFITYAPTFALVAPVAGTNATTGNITVSVAYRAQYVTAVNLYISASGGSLVYSSGFLQSTEGISVAKIWYEGTAGTYSYSIQAATPYATLYTNGTITVIALQGPSTGGTVYQNSTVYNNVTGGSSAAGYFGLSPPASGTVLLIVGLIVGILAGMVAARMMMSSAPAKPAQPWSDTKGTATNTCSVCGKSFGSADELAAHAKSEHGMQ